MMNEAIPIPTPHPLARLLPLCSLSSLLTYLVPTWPIIEHSGIILEKQYTPSYVCTFGVRIVICKWQRKTSDLLLEVCSFNSVNTSQMTQLLPAMLKVLFHFSPSALSRSLDEKRRWKKNMFQAKSIIKIPYPTPPGVANWYSAGFSGPLWCSQSPTRKERIESY